MIDAKVGQSDNGLTSHHAEPVEIWRTRLFIRDHLDEKLSLSRLAQAAKISPNYLSEKFKEVTGENVVRYISRARVEEAQRLLENGNRRISEIAFSVGFQSLSQFNRSFKKNVGISPSRYRAGSDGVKPVLHVAHLAPGGDT